jgi:hypothetical protein
MRVSLGRESRHVVTSAEWLRSANDFPTGGLSLQTTYKSGSGTSWIYKPWFDPILGPALGCSLQPGSLNLWADVPVALPGPARAVIDGIEWLFVPLVVQGTEPAVAARKASFGAIEFIEVFACDHLASKLHLTLGDRVEVRLYSGEHLGLAA